MAVELVVGVLPDAAGVEDDHVGRLHVRRGHEAVGHQRAGQPLGVVLVHLAPEGADVEGPRAAARSPHQDTALTPLPTPLPPLPAPPTVTPLGEAGPMALATCPTHSPTHFPSRPVSPVDPGRSQPGLAARVASLDAALSRAAGRPRSRAPAWA